MIKKRNIIILLAVILVLCGATAGLFMWDGTQNDDTVDDSFNSGDTIYIYDGNADELSKINVTLPDDEFEFVKVEADKWQISGLEGSPVKNYSIKMLADDLSKLTARSVVEENATDLAKYGLDNPLYKITGDFASGEKTFYAGNSTPVGDGYYFKDADTNTVYTVYNTRFTSLFSSKESYRDITFVKTDMSSLKSISITRGDTKVDVNAMDNPVEMNGFVLAGWEMTTPYKCHLDDSRLQSLVTEKLPKINVISVASDKKDYAKYGLDNPYAEFTVSDTAGISQTVKISPADDGEYYAVTDGDDTIYLLGSDGLDFVDVKPFDLVSKFAYITNIDSVSEVVVNAQGEKYVLSISGNDDEKKYTLNGAEIEEDVFKKELYQNIIGLICTDFCADAVYGAPEIVIEYTMNDGSKDKVEFVNYNDRNYAVFKNGECNLQILKKEVNSMVEAIKNNVK